MAITMIRRLFGCDHVNLLAKYEINLESKHQFRGSVIPSYYVESAKTYT
jgi:hypothetical protein